MAQCWVRGKDLFAPQSLQEFRECIIEKRNQGMDISDDFLEENLQYLHMVEKTFTPQVSGPSGTMDRLLTLSIYLGVDSLDDMMDMRLAAIAWMVPEDHSLFEVLWPGGSFGLHILPNHQLYETIYPKNPEFYEALIRVLKKDSLNLPNYYLTEECLLYVKENYQNASFRCSPFLNNFSF
jgi:hypothetical protein